MCSECGNKEISNKHFKLCVECNNLRLYGNPYGKIYESNLKRGEIKRSGKRISSSKKSRERTSQAISKDEEAYKKVFDNKAHRCEECGCSLPDIFRDENNRVVARYQYSHIIPKSIAPKKLRHDVINFNRLCLTHHIQWENGDKENMRIFKKNSRIFPEYLTK